MVGVSRTMAGAVERGQGPECLQGIMPTLLDGAEREALKWLRRRGERKEG